MVAKRGMFEQVFKPHPKNITKNTIRNEDSRVNILKTWTW